MGADKVVDYYDLISRSTRSFVGRQWVRDAVADFLRAEGPMHFLLLGEPGCGKTAFLADLMRSHGWPHHFIGRGSQLNIGASPAWRSPVRLAESIGYQLVRDYGGWVMPWDDWGLTVQQEVKDLQGLLVGAAVDTFRGVPRPEDRPVLTVKQETEQFGPAARMIGVSISNFAIDPKEAFTQLLLKPLERVAKRWPEHQLVVVIDGLDEDEGYRGGGIVQLLPTGDLPPNVRFVLSSRPGSHLTPVLFAHAKRFWLSENEQGLRSPHALRDAEEYLVQLTADEPVWGMLQRKALRPETLARGVAEASGGNFLYLHHYAEGLRHGDESLLDLRALPKGLFQIYEHFLSSIKSRREDVSWTGAYKPVLGTLAVAREPLTQRQLADFAGVDRETVASILSQSEQFLEEIDPTGDTRYAVYHSSFGEFLTSEKNKDYIDGPKAHFRIADHFLKSFGGLEAGLPELSAEPSPGAEARYGLNHLPTHLRWSQQWDQLATLLRTLKFLEAKSAVGKVFDLVADFAVALGSVPSGHQFHEHRLLDEALRRDVHFINRHPAALFQCLWNTCWWYDSPEAAEHYDRKLAEFTSPAPWERREPTLYRLLERWRQDKEARELTPRWARALRPPAMPLKSSLLTVLSTGDRYAFSVDLNDEPKAVLVCSETPGEQASQPAKRAVTVWQPNDLIIPIATENQWIVSACFVAHGKRVATCGTELRCWDTQTGRLVKAIEKVSSGYRTCALSPDGEYLAVATYAEKGELLILDAASFEVQQRWHDLHAGRITDVSFDSTGERLVTSSEDCTLRIWDRRTGSLLQELRGHGSPVTSVVVSPQGLIASGSGPGMGAYEPDKHGADKSIRLWDIERGQEVGLLEGHEDSVTSVAFSPDGRLLASGSGDPVVGQDYSLRLWDVSTRKQLARWHDHAGAISQIVFSDDGKCLASAAWDGTVRLWSTDLSRDASHLVSHGDEVCIVAICPTGKTVISTSWDDPPRLWDAGNGALRAVLEGHTALVRSVGFSRDGRYVVTGSGSKYGDRDCTARVWDARMGRLQAVLEHKQPVTMVVYSSNNRYLVTGEAQVASMAHHPHTIRIWDARSWQLLHTITSRDSWLSDIAISLRSGMNDTEFENMLEELRDRGIDLPRNDDRGLLQVAPTESGIKLILREERGPGVAEYNLPITALGRHHYHPGCRLWACASGHHLLLYRLEGAPGSQ